MSDDMNLSEVNQSDSPSRNTSDEIPSEWQQLSGRTQERIKKLIEIKNEAVQKAQFAEEEAKRNRFAPPSYVPMPTANPSLQMSDEERAAAARLQELNFTTKKDLESIKEELKREMEAERARDLLDSTHEKLEKKYSQIGYDRKEVEDLMAQTGIYDPEYHFEKKYRDEILQVEGTKKGSSQPFTERTRSRISSSSPITPEMISERAKQPGWLDYYKKNKAVIDKVTAQWERGEG